MSDLNPTGVDLKDSKQLFIVSWDDGSETRLGYRAMRLGCRCALCIDELTGRPLLDPATVPEDVGIDDCKEVGLYGIQITWSTGHSTGIYTWERLQALAGGQ
jgi:ATP-binding protein involved in chromosome partitioning